MAHPSLTTAESAKQTSSTSPSLPSPPSPTFPSTRVNNALQILRQSGRGRNPYKGDYQALALDTAEFAQLLNEIRIDQSLDNWFQCKLRYDWIPDDGILGLRMATYIHEGVLGALTWEVLYWLKTMKIQDKLRYAHSAKMELRHGEIKCPDGLFTWRSNGFHPFITELAYSQTTESLKRKAKKYMKHTKCGVKTILTLDMSYHPPNATSKMPQDRTIVRIYRRPEKKDTPWDITEHVVDQHSSNDYLILELSDFLPDGVTTQDCIPAHMHPAEANLKISSDWLYKTIQEVKKEDEAARARKTAENDTEDEKTDGDEEVDEDKKMDEE